jgi:D-glycero-D-manno-heptose 1,7-bisphosphate phosphatase
VTRRAAFLDRDGTIIEDVNYIARPEDARLRPGAAEAIRTLNERGLAVVVITNQSGISRGFFTEADYHDVRARVTELLAAERAHVDAEYYCPHYPDATGPCECRKPGTLLFDRAISDLDIDASTSLFAGDRLRDILPARHYGGRAYLVKAESSLPDEIAAAREVGAEIVDSLLDAVHRFR